MKQFSILCLLLLVTLSSVAETSRVGRYYSVNNEAVEAHYFPLHELKSINIPSSTVSIGKAVDYILQGTGYAQAQRSARSTDDFALMAKPLASINREFDNVTVLEMLRAVAGLGYVVIVDPLNKLIAFEVENGFAQ